MESITVEPTRRNTADSAAGLDADQHTPFPVAFKRFNERIDELDQKQQRMEETAISAKGNHSNELDAIKSQVEGQAATLSAIQAHIQVLQKVSDTSQADQKNYHEVSQKIKRLDESHEILAQQLSEAKEKTEVAVRELKSQHSDGN